LTGLGHGDEEVEHIGCFGFRLVLEEGGDGACGEGGGEVGAGAFDGGEGVSGLGAEDIFAGGEEFDARAEVGGGEREVGGLGSCDGDNAWDASWGVVAGIGGVIACGGDDVDACGEEVFDDLVECIGGWEGVGDVDEGRG